MLHLIWPLLNGIILLFFLYLLIGFIAKGKKVFKPPIKVISIFILVIGIVQIISASGSEKPLNRIIMNKDYDNGNHGKISEVVLEENLTFDINLLVRSSGDREKFIPVESNSYLTGLVSGFEWEYESIETEAFGLDNEAAYVAKGILKWNLFGITVFREAKTFRGTIK